MSQQLLQLHMMAFSYRSTSLPATVYVCLRFPRSVWQGSSLSGQDWRGAVPGGAHKRSKPTAVRPVCCATPASVAETTVLQCTALTFCCSSL